VDSYTYDEWFFRIAGTIFAVMLLTGLGMLMYEGFSHQMSPAHCAERDGGQ
jgi:hypothetical protein